MRLKQAIDKFIYSQKIRGNSTRTIEFYIETLQYFTDFFNSYGFSNIEELSKNFYDDYVLMLLDKNIKRVSVRTYLRGVKSFLRYLADEKLIDDWAYDIKLPKGHQDKIVTLSDAEILKLLGIFSCDDILSLRNMCIVLLMLDCGLRRGEVLQLKKNDVDFDNNMLIINGKGSKQRFVPIGKITYDYLKEYDKNARSCSSFFADKCDCDISVDVIKKLFQKLKKQTGISRLHPHLLRHTFATRYLVNGGNLEALRLLLGHSDIYITQVYLHLSEYYKIIHNQHISLVDRIKNRGT